MSLHDLKARLSDIPAAQNLTMELSGGRIFLKWGDGFSAATDATASDAEIETAVRNAARLPPVALIEDRPAVAPSTAPSTPAPATRPASGHPADAMSALDRSMASHVAQMQELIDGQVRLIEAKQGRQRQTVEKHLTAFGDRLDEQTDAFEAIMARYSNGGPV